MRINVYRANAVNTSAPIRIRKWVRNIIEAQSFCAWYKRTHGEEVTFAIMK